MRISLLRVLSVSYLLLPNILFSVFWFRYQYSIPLLVGYCYLFLVEIRRPANDAIRFSASDLAFLLFFALFWTFCTGISGLSFQTYDYWAHNAKYYDLFMNRWPIFFPEKNVFVCYYFGYYLVPAFISKYTQSISGTALFIWSAFGFLLGSAWVYSLIGKRKILLLFFICFGGVGHAIKVILSKSALNSFHLPHFLTEIWSTFDQSLWVPNQVIPALIITGIFLYDAFIRKQVEASFFPIILIFIWAVFPAVVLTVLYFFVSAKSIRYINLRSLFSNYLLPGLLFLPAFVYLASSSGMSVKGFIWEFEPTYAIWLEYCIGVLVDLVLYYVIYFKFRRESAVLFPKWFAHLVFLVFLLMSFYRIGVMNDWMIRGSIPLVMIISIILLRTIEEYSRTNRLVDLKYFPVFASFFLLCFVNPVAHIKRSLGKNVFVNSFNETITFVPIPYDKYRNTYYAIKAKFSEKEADQYLGRKNSVYAFYLARLP